MSTSAERSDRAGYALSETSRDLPSFDRPLVAGGGDRLNERMDLYQKAGIAGMSVRYVAQRDLDGSWSVREIASNRPALLRGTVQVGLSEDLAAIRTKKLNDHIIEADNSSRDLAGASIRKAPPR